MQTFSDKPPLTPIHEVKSDFDSAERSMQCSTPANRRPLIHKGFSALSSCVTLLLLVSWNIDWGCFGYLGVTRSPHIQVTWFVKWSAVISSSQSLSIKKTKCHRRHHFLHHPRFLLRLEWGNLLHLRHHQWHRATTHKILLLFTLPCKPRRWHQYDEATLWSGEVTYDMFHLLNRFIYHVTFIPHGAH